MEEKAIWVRSKWNPQATDEEKWKLVDCPHNNRTSASDWTVRTKDGLDTTHDLPKSDYVLCEAPVQWERVEVSTEDNFIRNAKGKFIGDVKLPIGYRVVSLAVERRKG